MKLNSVFSRHNRGILICKRFHSQSRKKENWKLNMCFPQLSVSRMMSEVHQVTVNN